MDQYPKYLYQIPEEKDTLMGRPLFFMTVYSRSYSKRMKLTKRAMSWFPAANERGPQKEVYMTRRQLGTRKPHSTASEPNLIYLLRLPNSLRPASRRHVLMSPLCSTTSHIYYPNRDNTSFVSRKLNCEEVN